MKNKIFSIYDTVAGAYMAPWLCPTIGMALRNFEDLLSQDNAVSKHPGDYVLFQVGEFDDSTGVLTDHQDKINLGTAAQFKKTVPTLKEA